MKTVKDETKQFITLLAPLNLHPEAVKWLSTMWEVFQGLDDWRDNDPLPKQEIEQVIYQVLVECPQNQFFQANANRLLPILSTAVLKWIGANVVEDEKVEEALSKAFVWRAGFYDLVVETTNICNGFEFAQKASPYIMCMYGETFENYVKEFNNA